MRETERSDERGVRSTNASRLPQSTRLPVLTTYLRSLHESLIVTAYDSCFSPTTSVFVLCDRYVSSKSVICGQWDQLHNDVERQLKDVYAVGSCCE
uniref:Uncharacterized protein n=1 Tax=Steinernema glaseri TaxID=37863 RepID=A0A1I7YPM1_9BILA